MVLGSRSESQKAKSVVAAVKYLGTVHFVIEVSCYVDSHHLGAVRDKVTASGRPRRWRTLRRPEELGTIPLMVNTVHRTTDGNDHSPLSKGMLIFNLCPTSISLDLGTS